jgi:hypothetical protein
MFNASHTTNVLARRGQDEALATWRDAAGLVRIRWQVFREADDPGSRSRAFAAYVAALDAEEAAASEFALLSSYDIAA